MIEATDTKRNSEQDETHNRTATAAQRATTEIEIQIENPQMETEVKAATGPLTSNSRVLGDEEEQGDDDEEQLRSEVQLSDFIGDHGFYQLTLSLLLFVRYVLLGLMANSGPLMTPDVTFYCQLPMQEILYIMPNISTLSAREQELEIREEFKQVCQIDLHLYQNQSQLMSNSSRWLPGQSFKTSPISYSSHHGLNKTSGSQSVGDSNESLLKGSDLEPVTTSNSFQQPNGRIRECTEFTYQLAPDQGRTLTSEFNLVCDDDWLRSLFQSLLSAAIVVAHVFWGTFSDKYGRFQAQRICLVISLLAGTLSIFAWDFWSFTLLRALCSFGDLGMVVSMTTTMVELVGSNYRGLSVALVNFGYALGVSLLPYLVGYCQDFRLMVGVTVLCHMVTMPFVLATNESIRWLLTNRKHELARRELKRIMRWNQNCAQIWPNIRRHLFHREIRRRNVKKEATKQQNLSNNLTNYKEEWRKRSGSASSGRKISSSSAALLERKQEFQLKFEAFIKQLEGQNLCEPTSNCPVHYPTPMPTPRPSTSNSRTIATAAAATVANRQVARQSNRQRAASIPQMPLPRSRFEPLLRRELSPTPSNQHHQDLEPVDEIETSLGAEIKPRILNMVDPENLELIRAVESVAQQVVECSVSIAADRGSISSGSDVDHEHHHQAGECGEFYNQSLRQRQQQQQCQPDCINMFAHQLSFVGRVSRLFRDKKLMIATFTIVWTTFNSELLYTSFIIINLYAGEDVYLNYVIGGCAEAVAAIVASLLLSYSPRRLSLIAFWLLISFSCFGLSLAHIDNMWAVWLLALAKFSQSCLSSIASVAAYESFPTFLRQSGSGLVFTLGMMGSVFAPLIFAEFDDHAGMDRVLIIFSISSLTAALLIYKFLKETRDCELM